MTEPARSRWRRCTAVGAAVLFALCLLLVLGRCAARHDDPVRAAVAAAEARRAKRNPERPAAYGETAEGSAFAHYAEAWELASKLIQSGLGEKLSDGWFRYEDGRIVFRDRSGEPRADIKPQGLLADAAPLLAALHRGAHARDARPSGPGPGFALDVAFMAAREARDRSNWSTAVPLWLDAATAALDSSSERLVADTMWSMTEVAALPPAIRRQLDRGLEILDRRLDHAADPASIIAPYAGDLLDGDNDWSLEQRLQSWDHGFDPTSKLLDSFATVLPHLTTLEPEALSGREREQQWQKFRRSLAHDKWDFLTEHAVACAEAAERTHRRVRTALRMLRIGLAAVGGEPLPALIDPYSGTAFAIESRSDEVVVHSAEPRVPCGQSPQSLVARRPTDR